MPTYKNKTILNLKPDIAYSRGYLSKADHTSHAEWVRGNFEERHIKTFVYVDGVYLGMATSKTKLWEIIEKFNI